MGNRRSMAHKPTYGWRYQWETILSYVVWAIVLTGVCGLVYLVIWLAGQR